MGQVCTLAGLSRGAGHRAGLSVPCRAPGQLHCSRPSVVAAARTARRAFPQQAPEASPSSSSEKVMAQAATSRSALAGHRGNDSRSKEIFGLPATTHRCYVGTAVKPFPSLKLSSSDNYI